MENKYMFRKVSNSLVSFLIITSIALLGCNSTEQTKTNNEEHPDTAVINTAITLDDRSYDLLELEGLAELSFKAYWPVDAELSEAEIEAILSSLLAINRALNEHINLSLSSFRNKSIVFTPITNASHSDVQFTQNDGEQLQVTFPNDVIVIDEYFSQKVLSFFYISERAKQTKETDLFSEIITQGLALHFIEEAFETNKLYQSVFLAENELAAALIQVRSALNDDSWHSDWFEPDGIAAPVGYYLAAQHFSHYPGSYASNTLSLKSDIFTSWLDNPSNAVHKLEQYVRTDDVDNQVKVSELTRQANKFFGSYFLEGYNEKKLIALTFDDGPSQYTAKILDVLEQADVKASFFWQGSRLASYTSVIERTLIAGHTIANHSWNHPHSGDFSTQTLWQQQVQKTNEQMQDLFGITPRFYRPPYGEISDEQVTFLEQKGMKVMLWSVDSRDWNSETNTVEHIRSKIINHQHAEMITLMHDSGGNRQNTVDALPAIIEHYQNQGYRFVNLQTLLGISDKG